jgi:hypothetical protein
MSGRIRASKAEMQERRQALFGIIARWKPMTVRQVFYQATVIGIIDKTEAGYDKVGETLVQMRREGMLPYDWIVDNTRWQRRPRTYDSIQDALDDSIETYRKSLWTNADSYVEIWLEKDALTGVLLPITGKYDVPLMTARGYASLSFLYEAADYLQDVDVPAYIYHFGDYDHAGVHAGTKIEEELREMAPDTEIHFERIAVLPRQIREWRLPTRPAKRYQGRPQARLHGRAISETHAVELDAIRPDLLRDLCERTIQKHLPQEEFKRLLKIEAAEKAAAEEMKANWEWPKLRAKPRKKK